MVGRTLMDRLKRKFNENENIFETKKVFNEIIWLHFLESQGGIAEIL